MNTTSDSSPLDRRSFIKSTAAAAAAFTIVPSKVIAGTGHIPPSEKITVANIGCGTQGVRELNTMLTDERIQVVALCDPNRRSEGYLDWDPRSLLENIRNTLGDPNWGSLLTDIPGGLDLSKQYVEDYYAKNTPSGSFKGVAAYEDFRELFAHESGIDAVKIMTPDHLHATIAIAAMNKGMHAITHKPVANRMSEARLVADTARRTGLKTHLLAWYDTQELALVRRWIEDGVIGKLQSIRSWSARPVWPQYLEVPEERPRIPDGFNWTLWQGPVPDRPYHPHYTHNVFRGWYDFGGGAIADMGHYIWFSLFQKFGLTKPAISARAYGTTYRTVVDECPRWVRNDYAFPLSCTIKFRMPAQNAWPEFDLYWYDGGIKPFEPEELEIDGRLLPDEGLFFMGDQGVIMADFMGRHPEILPAARMKDYRESRGPWKITQSKENLPWADAIKNDYPSAGSFLEAEAVTETINLGAVALRAGTRVDYDSANLRITNHEEANQYLTREYRPGWELS